MGRECLCHIIPVHADIETGLKSKRQTRRNPAEASFFGVESQIHRITNLHATNLHATNLHAQIQGSCVQCIESSDGSPSHCESDAQTEPSLTFFVIHKERNK